jgi:BMFP domain-containing protein YqiC
MPPGGAASQARPRQGTEPLRACASIPIVGARFERAGALMVQTTNRFFDEVSRLFNDAAGVASGVRREVDTVVRTQAERILRDLDLVKREEFEAVKDMVQLAREENEALKARIQVLEASLAGRGTATTASGSVAAAPRPSADEPPIL